MIFSISRVLQGPNWFWLLFLQKFSEWDQHRHCWDAQSWHLCSLNGWVFGGGKFFWWCIVSRQIAGNERWEVVYYQDIARDCWCVRGIAQDHWCVRNIAWDCRCVRDIADLNILKGFHRCDCPSEKGCLETFVQKMQDFYFICFAKKNLPGTEIIPDVFLPDRQNDALILIPSLKSYSWLCKK